MSGGVVSLEKLTSMANTGEIDTVFVCMVDMQGSLKGKRFDARSFCNDISCGKGREESFELDQEIATIDPFTIRLCSWMPATALVLTDTATLCRSNYVNSRKLLKDEIGLLESEGLFPFSSCCLEWYLFEESFSEAHKKKYTQLNDLRQSIEAEEIMRAFRNHLTNSGVSVVSSSDYQGTGQVGLNLDHCGALEMGDNLTIARSAIIDIACMYDKSATFMAKPNNRLPGSSCTIQLSIRDKEGKNLFYDSDNQFNMSNSMSYFLAGLVACSEEIMWFFAPQVNSYKRLISMGKDMGNSSQGVLWDALDPSSLYQISGRGSGNKHGNGTSTHIICRIPGADVNPYFALSALLAAGRYGIQNKLTLQDSAINLPTTLAQAIETMERSKRMDSVLPPEVIKNCLYHAKKQQLYFSQQVTDWEKFRGFNLNGMNDMGLYGQFQKHIKMS